MISARAWWKCFSPICPKNLWLKHYERAGTSYSCRKKISVKLSEWWWWWRYKKVIICNRNLVDYLCLAIRQNLRRKLIGFFLSLRQQSRSVYVSNIRCGEFEMKFCKKILNLCYESPATWKKDTAKMKTNYWLFWFISHLTGWSCFPIIWTEFGPWDGFHILICPSHPAENVVIPS